MYAIIYDRPVAIFRYPKSYLSRIGKISDQAGVGNLCLSLLASRGQSWAVTVITPPSTSTRGKLYTWLIAKISQTAYFFWPGRVHERRHCIMDDLQLHIGYRLMQLIVQYHKRWSCQLVHCLCQSLKLRCKGGLESHSNELGGRVP